MNLRKIPQVFMAKYLHGCCVMRMPKLFYFLAIVVLLPFLGSCTKKNATGGNGRPSDSPIVPNYVVVPGKLKAVISASNGHNMEISALPGAYSWDDASGLRIAAIYLPTADAIRIKNSSNSLEPLGGTFIREIHSEISGDVLPVNVPVDGFGPGYLALLPFDEVGGTLPIPTSVYPKATYFTVTAIPDMFPASGENELGFTPISEIGNPGKAWLSRSVILGLPDSGPAFQQLTNLAMDQNAVPSLAINHPAHSGVYAAAIYSVRVPASKNDMHNKVIQALNQIIAVQTNALNTVAARNFIYYVLAADLIDYHSAAFDNFLSNKVPQLEQVVALEPTKTNGFTAMATLSAIYSYQGQVSKIALLSNSYAQLVSGTASVPGGSWQTKRYQTDPANPRIINSDRATAPYFCAATGLYVEMENILPVSLEGSDGSCVVNEAKKQDSFQALEALSIFLRITSRMNNYSIWIQANSALKRSIIEYWGVSAFAPSNKGIPYARQIALIYDETFPTPVLADFKQCAPDFKTSATFNMGLDWAFEATSQRACP